MIMNVAVPPPQHSDKFGQRASSHTVCSPFFLNDSLIWPYSLPDGGRILNHLGFTGAFAKGNASLENWMPTKLTWWDFLL
jgi:hypothetical protein